MEVIANSFNRILVLYMSIRPCVTSLREGFKKKTEKAVRLTAWVDPLPRSGQENVKNFDFDF